MDILKKSGDTAQQDKDKESDLSSPDQTITTGVDALLKLLEGFPKLTIEETAKRLKVKKDVLKSWIEFLVEEKILGIEYSFTTPYIYLNKPKEKEKATKIEDKKMSYPMFRQEFEQRAKNNKIPDEKIPEYWKKHLTEKMELNKDFFLMEVRRRNLPHAEELWKKYTEKSLNA